MGLSPPLPFVGLIRLSTALFDDGPLGVIIAMVACAGLEQVSMSLGAAMGNEQLSVAAAAAGWRPDRVGPLLGSSVTTDSARCCFGRQMLGALAGGPRLSAAAGAGGH